MISGLQSDRRPRRRVRHKVHAPAYASFSGGSQSIMLELNEILDISEDGVKIQCSSPMEADRSVELCLDLAESSGQIHTTGQVVWSDGAGRVGLRLPNLADAPLRRLREWLFLNAMVAAANAGSFVNVTPQPSSEAPAVRPNFTDTLTAVSAVQREAESLGSSLDALLALVASRAQTLLQASGAAIALAEEALIEAAMIETAMAEAAMEGGETTEAAMAEPAAAAAGEAAQPLVATMICRASAGPSAPPAGARLQVGLGFSGACVRTGLPLRCDDAATDLRVDRESCRVLGIRSILAIPLRIGEKVIGLLEVFSDQPSRFAENDSAAILQRLAETILSAVQRSAPVPTQAAPPLTPAVPFAAPQGSVLFAQADEKWKDHKGKDRDKNEDDKEKDKQAADDPETGKPGGIRLPRTHLFLLILAAATVFLVLGFILAPWIQERFHSRDGIREQTVLASSPQPATSAAPAASVDSATLEELRQMATQGNPGAENALGLRYATGDGVKLDEPEAARWFTLAAEHGNVPAQSKLGQLYWGGRGVPASLNQAYFWTILARAAGHEGSKALAPMIASRMSRAQAAAVEQQAEAWYRQHEPQSKPAPGH